MNKKYISALYVVNIVFQAIFTLAMYVGAAVLLGWLSTSFWGAQSWIYVPLILGGVLLGLISMVKFVLSAMKALESIERQHESDRKKAKEKERLACKETNETEK